MVGLYKESDEIIGTAFDILALEALFLIPRLSPNRVLLVLLLTDLQTMLGPKLEPLLWYNRKNTTDLERMMH